MFNSFTKPEKDLISSNQSGFKSGNLCMNQLLSITCGIYKAFDFGFLVRGFFVDISKAFYNVWLNGVIFKLEQNGISANLHKIVQDF